MRTRVLGVLLLAAVVGVGGGLFTGWGVGYLRQPQLAAGGAATPLPASSPSVPVDPPPTIAPYDPDVSYPALVPGLRFELLAMGNSVQAWRVPVPRKWAAFSVPAGVFVPKQERSEYDELRFRPRSGPDTGSYSLRVKTINSHVSASSMVTQRLAAVREAYAEVTVLDRATDSIRFTFRDGSNHLRFNYFRYFTGPQSAEASLEMSVAGRKVDVGGLDALFAAFASTLQPADQP